jgi:hypothetical protein
MGYAAKKRKDACHLEIISIEKYVIKEAVVQVCEALPRSGGWLSF